MLLLFFGSGSSSSGSGGGHPGKRRGSRYGLPVVMNDDDAALQLLLDAEDRDRIDALLAYETALRRVL